MESSFSDKLTKLNQKILFIPKVLYFAISAVFYLFHQFRGQFMRQVYGIPKREVGFLLSIPQALSFFSNMALGSFNDSTGKQKILLIGLLVIGCCFFETFFYTSDKYFFLFLYCIYFAFMSASVPLLDKVMLDYVSEIPGMGPKTFGSQRIWLTFGYLFTNFTVEGMIETDDPEKQNFKAMKPFNFISTAIAIFLVILYVKNLGRRPSSTSYLSSVGALLKNAEYMYFIFIILLSGISRAFMTNYLGIYYSEGLKFSKQVNTWKIFGPIDRFIDFCYAHKQSTSTLFGVSLELIGFFYSYLITDYLGYFWPILLSMGFQLARFAAYYALPYDSPSSFAFCCLIEMLKGANFSLIHTSALQLANLYCPPSLRTTSQILYNGTFVAVSSVAAGLLFGSLFNPKTVAAEDVSREFKEAFKWNMILTIVGMVFFVGKYGIYENLLFSRSNASKKIKEIKERAKAEEEIHQQEARVDQNNTNVEMPSVKVK